MQTLFPLLDTQNKETTNSWTKFCRFPQRPHVCTSTTPSHKSLNTPTTNRVHHRRLHDRWSRRGKQKTEHSDREGNVAVNLFLRRCSAVWAKVCEKIRLPDNTHTELNGKKMKITIPQKYHAVGQLRRTTGHHAPSSAVPPFLHTYR